MEASKDRILLWLAEEGLDVRLEPVPPGVPLEWVILVQIPGVIKVNVAVQQPKGKTDIVAITMGIMVGPDHRDSLSKLTREERFVLTAGILRDLIMVCPDCVIVIQPSLEDPQFINITKLTYTSTLTKESLLSAIRLMVNMFTLVVTDINATLASKGLYRRSHESMVM